MHKYLKPYIWHNSFLLSHAGVTNTILKIFNTDINGYLKEERFNDIGYARGGSSPFGGLYWCDWFREFEPVPGVKQIVGHTGYRPVPKDLSDHEMGILEKEGNYNVDCLNYKEEFLIIKQDGSVEIKHLGEVI
jgi:hypothetical protein